MIAPMVPSKKEMPRSIREELREVLFLKATPESDHKIVSAYNEYLELSYMKHNCEPCTNYAKMMLKRYLTQP